VLTLGWEREKDNLLFSRVATGQLLFEMDVHMVAATIVKDHL
jgi:hypothetical protein